MNKKIFMYIAVGLIFVACVLFGLTVAYNVYRLNAASEISQQVEDYEQSFTEVESTTSTEVEGEVEFTLNDAPIEGDDVNRNVTEVVYNLCNELSALHSELLDECEELDVIVDSVNDGDVLTGYDICISGLTLLGYYKDIVTIYHVNTDGTYDTYPDIYDVEHYVEDVVRQHESALLSADQLVGVNLFSGVFNPIKDINNEVSLVSEEYGYVFYNFRIDDRGDEVDIYGILQNDNEVPIIKCTTTYDTINGKVLNLERLINEEVE